MKILLELPFPDRKLSPNARVHWRTKAAATKTAKEESFFLTKELQNKPDKLEFDLPEEMEATFVFYPPKYKRKRDLDNLLASMKPYVDGVAEALGFDDARIKRLIAEWGERTKKGKVLLIISDYNSKG